MFREDYARAGFPMLPVLEPDGRSTGRQAMLYSAALVPLSLAPTLIGLTGRAYFVGALALAAIFLTLAREVRHEPQPSRRASAVLRIDHLPAAAVDPDDRQPRVTIADLPALNATLNAHLRGPADDRLRADPPRPRAAAPPGDDRRVRHLDAVPDLVPDLPRQHRLEAVSGHRRDPHGLSDHPGHPHPARDR